MRHSRCFKNLPTVSLMLIWDDIWGREKEKKVLELIWTNSGDNFLKLTDYDLVFIFGAIK